MLLGILLRFRKERIAVTADIEHMFYNFHVSEEHRDYLRFLWFEDYDPQKPLVDYRMTVHVFGNIIFPAVATYGIRKIVENCEEDGKAFVNNDFYVDDGLTSLPTVQQAVSLLSRTSKAFEMEGIKMHKIASNSDKVMMEFPPKCTGRWSQRPDVRATSCPEEFRPTFGTLIRTHSPMGTNDAKPYTKRGVLSTINSLYNPIDFLTPVVLEGRLCMRDLMTSHANWDSPLPLDKHLKWTRWKESLLQLKHINIPRTYSALPLCEASDIEVNVYSDASEAAIAAVAYLLIHHKGSKPKTTFIMGKSKLAPPRGNSIPRLELCGAVLATEVTEIVLEHLNIAARVRFFVDSKVVLGYIANRCRRFYTYVANRVERIKQSTSPAQWSYVPTNLNPEDCRTRGVAAENLVSSSWPVGPRFSGSAENKVPYCLVNPDEDKEVRPEVTTMATNVAEKIKLVTARFSRISSWIRLLIALSCIKTVKISQTVLDVMYVPIHTID